MIKTKSHASDFPNYTISPDGVVTNKRGVELKGEISNAGYKRVSLSNNHVKHQKMSVHRLVAETYIPNPDNLPEVNHKNEDKLDNRVENLEWCTTLYNLNHSHVIDKASAAKFTKVRCITTGEEYNSIKEASNALNLHHSNIVACCNGRRPKCGGMEWEYIKKEK